MDVFQREAFAKATGRSVNELFTLLQTNKELNHALAFGSDKAKEMAKEFQRLRDLSEANKKALGANGELMLQQKINQELMANIANSLNQIWIKAGAVILPPVAYI